MRPVVLHLFLFMWTPAINAQTMQPINKSLPSSANNRWDTQKYCWGHAHNNTSKNNKLFVDFNAIDSWQGMSDNVAVSNNGSYFAYGIESGPFNRKKQDSLIVQATDGSGWRHAFAGMRPGFFAANNKQYILQHQDSLYFLQLGSDKFKVINNVRSYITTGGANQCMAYQVKTAEKSVILLNLLTGQTKQFHEVKRYTFDDSKKWLVCETNNPAKGLIICNLESGHEQTFPRVTSYTFSREGNRLLINTGNALQYINVTDQSSHIIYTIQNNSVNISGCQFDATEKQVLFIEKDDSASKPLNTIWYYKEGMPQAIVKLNQQTPGIADDAQILSATFTDNGKYIQLEQQQQAVLRTPTRDAVGLDVWSYKDLQLQATQVYALKQGQLYHTIIGTADWQVKWQEVDNEQLLLLQADYALVKKSRTPKLGRRFWENEDRHDKDTTWVVSLQDGKRRLLPVSGKNTFAWFSPGGHYLVYFDAQRASQYFSYDLWTGQTVNVSGGIPPELLGDVERYVLTDKKPNRPCGLAAWLENDAGLLVYDNHDVWQLDLTGKTPAINLTHGFGHAHDIIFSLMNNERYSKAAPVALKAYEQLLLRAFHTLNKTNGFYRIKAGIASSPELLSMGQWFMHIIDWCQDPNISNAGLAPIKAQGRNTWIVQRQLISDAPNYFATKDFKSFKRLTNLQPQRGRQWLTEELHSFTHLDGKNGQGILYKPEDFDSSKKYPVLIVFYGGYSNNMYQFPIPLYNYDAITPGSSPVWLVNNGYLVFTPDIYITPYHVGPGAFDVIEGAANYLKNLPFVDSSGLGCASHSWSAKLGAYIFTHSKALGAMTISEGFLYANMINVALSFEENGESMINQAEDVFHFGNLWENRDAWIEQTTVLNVHKSKSPLLLFCNKNSSKEYLDQTQQLFTALWRLEKKVWWLKYDKGGHVLFDLNEQKDYTIRYTQYFDHYLKRVPAPKWMTQGIPAALKGIEARYELDPAGGCGKDCKICQQWNEQFKKNPAMFELPISDWRLDPPQP